MKMLLVKINKIVFKKRALAFVIQYDTMKMLKGEYTLSKKNSMLKTERRLK